MRNTEVSHLYPFSVRKSCLWVISLCLMLISVFSLDQTLWQEGRPQALLTDEPQTVAAYLYVSAAKWKVYVPPLYLWKTICHSEAIKCRCTISNVLLSCFYTNVNLRICQMCFLHSLDKDAFIPCQACVTKQKISDFCSVVRKKNDPDCFVQCFSKCCVLGVCRDNQEVHSICLHPKTRIAKRNLRWLPAKKTKPTKMPFPQLYIDFFVSTFVPLRKRQ